MRRRDRVALFSDRWLPVVLLVASFVAVLWEGDANAAGALAGASAGLLLLERSQRDVERRRLERLDRKLQERRAERLAEKLRDRNA